MDCKGVRMIPTVICSLKGSRSYAVTHASINAYSKSEILLSQPKRSTFGESYNAALVKAFKKHDEVIIANDDIAVLPWTYDVLMEDVATIKSHAKGNGYKVGFIGARFDSHGIQTQNIKHLIGKENDVFAVEVVAPVFAYLSKEAFEAAQFPPLNWFSDNLMCMDLLEKGFRHFVSRSYVHHVGSMSIGTDHDRLTQESKKWIRKNRPDAAEKMFPSLSAVYESMCAEPSDINEHLPTLSKLANGCEVIVELGMRYGLSTVALLHGIKTGTVHSYDLQKTFAVHGISELAKDNDINFVFTEADCLEVDIPECDLLFIDTLHNYSQLKQELALHSAKSRKYIVMHDTTSFGTKDETGTGQGLNPAIREFLSSNKGWKQKAVYTNNNGLTILERV